MKHHTFVASSSRELIAKTDEALAQGLDPTLAIIFASVSLDINSIAKALGAYSFPVFGGSSCGEILVDSQAKVEFDLSAVVALIELPRDALRVRLFLADGDTCRTLGRRIGEWGTSTFAQPAFVVVAAGLKRDGEELVQGVLGACHRDAPLFGGLAGDDARFEESFAFTNGEATSDGAVVLLLDSEILAVDGTIATGWVGLGAIKTATRSEGNVLFTMDGESSLEVYKRYLNLVDSDLPAIGVEFPLLVVRPDGTKVLRAVMGVDRERGALIFAGTIPSGAKLQFAVAPGTQIVEAMRQEFGAFASRQPPPDLALVFSCMARRMALGPGTVEEHLALREVWQAPAIGLFTYGEFGRTGAGSCDFHNETWSVAAIRVK